MEATQSKYSNIDKNNIKSLISKCSIGNCNIIFDMLTLENIKMTKNNNGYFLNLSNISDNTIDKIKILLEGIDNQRHIPISNNIENDYKNYKMDDIQFTNDIILNNITNDDDDIEDEQLPITNKQKAQGNMIELDEVDEEEEDVIIDEEDANNDDDDDFSHKIIKKQELSPYLNKIMKRCKDIQRNNELDNDYNDDIDDNDISFDGLDELSPDLTYTL